MAGRDEPSQSYHRGPGDSDWGPREQQTERSSVSEGGNDPGERRLDLSLVIPAYNEADTIEQTIDGIDENVVDACESYEIIVVDDGSRDGTSEVLKRLSAERPDVRCLATGTNKGKGYAIREGCLMANGEYILFMDADRDLNGDRIGTFLQQIRETDADVVIGSKRHPESAVTYPLKRRILSKGYSLFIRVLFGLQVTDTQVGMKVLHRQVVEDVMPLLLVERYAYDVELLALAKKFEYTITEAPVTLDFDGRSSIDWKAVLRIGLDTVSVFVRLNLLRSYEAMHRAAEYTRELGIGGSIGGSDR